MQAGVCIIQRWCRKRGEEVTQRGGAHASHSAATHSSSFRNLLTLSHLPFRWFEVLLHRCHQFMASYSDSRFLLAALRTPTAAFPFRRVRFLYASVFCILFPFFHSLQLLLKVHLSAVFSFPAPLSLRLCFLLRSVLLLIVSFFTS